MLRNERGFTLFETLIVLSILSTLLLLPLITLPKKHSTDQYTANLAAEQFKEDLLLAQHVAMSTGRDTVVRFNNRTKEYVIRFNATEIYMKRPYISENMYIEYDTFQGENIIFTSLGHPRYIGSFSLYVDGNQYQFMIYLGKGMISYTKL